MDTYTTKFNAPTKYILKSQINPKNPSEIIQLYKYILLGDD